jgi:release factor glutamine methyltransferase
MALDAGRTYLPSQDTALLARTLRGYTGESCLEIGFGSGAVLDGLLSRFERVVGTDLVSIPQARAAKGRAEVVIADRATCFRATVFDLVAFNPPYLPSEGVEDGTVDGGRGGVEVPLRFLEEAMRVVRDGGSVVVLLSSESDIDTFKAECESRGLRVFEKASADLFFERLFVFEVRKRHR